MPLNKRATVVPAPYNVRPSQKFDGVDGQWSTFSISVGTPPQNFRILPSTQSPETWVIAPEGCQPSDPTDCQSRRGGEVFNGQASRGFLVNESSTWKEAGLYSVDTEKNLINETVNGLYGYDVLGLNGGNTSSTGDGISFPGQLVAGIASKAFFNGMFGLSARPISFSSGSTPAQSFMSTLRQNNRIPSLSYGYTAGASYQNKQTFGSLVLGGYDTSRFKNTSMSQPFSFSSNDDRQLTVGVQSITAANTVKGTVSMTTTGGHLSLIDSTVPHLWLPRAICDNFEQAFGLQYDAQTDLYFVNDTQHRQLLTLNPTVTFKLGNTAYDNGNSTNIVLPYSAFDLQVGWPISSSTLNYFPIRRAANDSQYVLGRTLLQEMYIIVDLERRNFTIAPAAFPDSNTPSYIVAISSRDGKSGSGSSIGTGAIVGIVVGALAVIAILLGVFFWLRRKKSLEKAKIAELEANQAKLDPAYAKVDPTPDGVFETGGAEIQELEGPGMHGYGTKQSHHDVNTHELAGQYGEVTHELPTSGQHGHTHELPSAAPVFEMEGDSTLTSYGRNSPYTPSGVSTSGLSPAAVSPAAVSPAQVSPYTPEERFPR